MGAVEPRPARDPEVLLAHTGWMRALALSLLGDPGAADDVVQDATVAALSHAPAREAELEPWLSRVVRNFAWRRRRGEQRRADREALLPPRDPQPTPADTLERLDLQQQVIEAVRSIDEPLRTALVQHYLEGKTSEKIAREQRVPAGTVRWRLKRGLEELRLRLDARFGSRETWVVLFAPLARPIIPPLPLAPAASSATSKVLTGVLTMNAAQFGLAAAVLAVAGGIAWWAFVESREAAESPVVEAGRADPARAALPLDRPSDAPRELAAAEAGGKRSEAAKPAAVESSAVPAPPAADAPPSAVVDARFVDEHGVPWSGVRFSAHELATVAEWKPGAPVASGADGRAAIEIALPAPRRPSSRTGDYKVLLSASRAGCGTIERWASVRDGATVHLGDVVLGAGVALRGRVVDEHGDGLAGAKVGVIVSPLSDDEGYARRHGGEGYREIPGTASGADGSFVVEGVSPGTQRLWAHAEGRRYDWTAPIEVPADRDVLGLELSLSPLLPTDRIAGRVVAPDGTPVANALLWFSERWTGNSLSTSTPVDAQGRFSLLVQRDGSSCSFTARDQVDRYSPTTVADVRPGTLDLEIRMHEKRWLAVRVRDADGGAVESAKFEVDASGLGAAASVSETGAGAYSVAVPDGKFRLEYSARGFRTSETDELDADALPATLEIVMRRAPVAHGRVIAAGAPVANAKVRVVRDDPNASATVSGYRCRYLGSHRDPTVATDTEGRFRIEYDGAGDFWLLATAEGWVQSELGPIDGSEEDRDLVVELTKGGAIEGRVMLPDGRDGEGAILALNHGDGSPRTLRAGPRGEFRVEGLSTGSWQVLAVASEIDPTSTTYSSTGTAAPIEWSCTVSAGRTTRYDLDLTRK